MVCNYKCFKYIDLKIFTLDNDAVYNEVLQRNQETAQKAITSALADSNAGTVVNLLNINLVLLHYLI